MNQRGTRDAVALGNEQDMTQRELQRDKLEGKEEGFTGTNENETSTIGNCLAEVGLPSQPVHSSYQYQSLQTLKVIRLAELLPGTSSDPIHILLHPRTLSDLPGYAAASYEWGESIRQHKIFCGGSVLKVTANLFALLRRFRSSVETQLLWIDAICINQEDLEERSQQVPLMRDIYQKAATVLIWLGKEKPYTREGLQVISQLANAFDLSRSEHEFQRRGSFGQFRNSLDVPCGMQLEALTYKPGWAGVTDLVSSRTYFMRLWVVQEIVLSSNAMVVCGEHRIPWESYNKAVDLIWNCGFLHKGIDDYMILRNAYTIGLSKMHLLEFAPSLWFLVSAFSEAQATNPRDRIFGLLGMLLPGPQVDALPVDYKKSTAKVYQEAAESIIVHEQNLSLWRYLNLDPSARPGDGLPSWAPHFSETVARFSTRSSGFLIKCKHPMHITGDVLTVHGIILDSIEEVTENFSEQNLKASVLSAFKHQLSLKAAVDPAVISKAALQTLVTLDPSPDDHKSSEPAFSSLISSWTLADLGITPATVAQNPGLRSLAHTYSALEHIYPTEVACNMQVQDLVSQDPVLKWMLDQIASGHGTDFKSIVEFDLYDTKLALGRNLFHSRKGFIGIGPAGRNDRTECVATAVQVGDVVAVVAKAVTPVILRPCEEGVYTLVGSAHIGNLLETPCFEGGAIPEPVPFCIR